MCDSEELDAEIAALLKANKKNREKSKQGTKSCTSTSSNSGGSSNGSKLQNIKFTVNVKNKEETLRKKFSGDDHVSDVAQAIIDQVRGNMDMKTVEGYQYGGKKLMDLHYSGKILKMDQLLSSLEGIKGDEGLNLTIFVVFTVDGGASLSHDEKKEERERFADFENEKRIKPSIKPDCIYGFDEKKLRVKMPCGHVFEPNTLFKITQMYVNNLTKCEIKCPILKCKQIWPFDIIISAADLDDKERINFSNILTKRKMLHSGNFQECKGCKGLVKKPENLKMIRVRCSSDSCKHRRDFCWYCGKDWIGGGFIVCGNNDCGTLKINNLLQTCKMVKPEYLNGVECPEFRHCPRCLTLVGWASACKHIRCWGCNKDFCFVCLSLKSEDNKWPCGTHRDKCVVHPRQSLK